MKANRTDSRSSPTRRWRVVGAAVVALVSVSACTSDPSAKRVARDIIEAEAMANPDLDEECLLDALDDFENDELKSIDADIEAENSDRNAAGEEALTEYQAALAACL